MSLANVPAWAAGQLPAAAQIAACEEVEPGLVRVDLADGASVYVAKPAASNVPLRGQRLTAREADAIGRIARGQRYQDIAADTFSALDTVKARLHRAYRKLGAVSGPNAVFLAVSTGQLAAPAPTPEDPR